MPAELAFCPAGIEMISVGKASGPEFFAAVDALGERPYYAPMKLIEKSR
jgi:hypothetical protein